MQPPIEQPIVAGRHRKRNLCSQVVEELGMRIVGGHHTPDRPFPNEAELERRHGVSRSVIREAVKTLAAKGLLESRTRTGIRALPPICWNLLDAEVLDWRYKSMPPGQFLGELFEVRLMIEPEAAALAAERADRDAIAVIAAAYAAMVEDARRGANVMEADLRFHQAILAATGNPLLLQVRNIVSSGLAIRHGFTGEVVPRFLAQHRAVLDGIEAGDGEAARAAMRRLLLGARDYIRAVIAETAGTAAPAPAKVL